MMLGGIWLNNAKIMDGLSVVGVLLAISAIIIGHQLEGGHWAALYNAPALLIVFGGSFGAVMLQARFSVFRRACVMSIWVFKPRRVNESVVIKRVVKWSQVARREGLLGLDATLAKEKERFARKGLQLLVDGREPSVIRATLEVDIDAQDQFDMSAANLFEAMGGYAPTIGILGAVMGLIHVMENLSEPSKLGEGIATAFVATIYGVGLANLYLLPVASKLKGIVAHQTKVQEILMEGIISIAEGENPKNIEVKLSGYTARSW